MIIFLFCVCRCFSYKLFPFFFSQRVLFYFIGKIFFRRTEAVAWRWCGNPFFQWSWRIENCNFIKKRLCHRCFLVNFAEKVINLNLETSHLEPSRTLTMELFRENSWRLKAVNYFRKKAPSQMFDWVLNTPLLLTIKYLYSSIIAEF